MPYVITEALIGNKDTSCWQVCPVDAIHPCPDGAGFARHHQPHRGEGDRVVAMAGFEPSNDPPPGTSSCSNTSPADPEEYVQ